MADDEFPLIPSWEDLDFAANCTAWGNWLATWLLPNPWNRVENLSGGFSTTLVLINESFPAEAVEELAGTGVSSRRLAGKLTEWWTYVMLGGFEYDALGRPIGWNTDSEFVTHVIKRGVEKCPREMCRAQAYTGNADITGIGIYIAYFMQATLATLYLLAFTVSHFRPRPIANRYETARHSLLGKRDKGAPHASSRGLTLDRRTLDAFRGSLDGFIVSAMLMCIAMISAALYLAVQGYKSNALPATDRALPFGDSSTYNMVLSVIAAAFSTFPVLVLYTLLSRRDGVSKASGGHIDFRRWLRRAALFVIWVLLIVEVYLSPRGNYDYERRHDEDQEANWDPCNKRGGARYWQTMKAAQWLVIGLPLVWLIISTFLTRAFGIPGLKDRRWIRDFADKDWVQCLREPWELGVAWFNLLVAWALLAYFSILREEIIETAGATDTANQWGFGQILTLATWAPVVAEWLYIFICATFPFTPAAMFAVRLTRLVAGGLEDSLNTRLPRGFEVTTSETYRHISTGREPRDHDEVELFYVNPASSTEGTKLRREAEESTERAALREETRESMGKEPLHGENRR